MQVDELIGILDKMEVDYLTEIDKIIVLVRYQDGKVGQMHFNFDGYNFINSAMVKTKVDALLLKPIDAKRLNGILKQIDIDLHPLYPPSRGDYI